MSNRSYSLLIDDVRNFHADFVIRSAKAAIEFFIMCQGNIQFDILYLDFDLGDGTGLEVLQQAFFNNTEINQIQIITMNPVGKKQLENYLKDICNYYQNEKNVWIKGQLNA